MKIDADYVNSYLGTEFKDKDVKKYLERMGFGAAGNKALVPAYRNDILHQVDLIEDIAIAYGYENFTPELPEISTVGEENPFTAFKNKISEILIGLGMIETSTFHIVNKEMQTTKMEMKQEAVELGNSLSEVHNSMRFWILPSLLNVLSGNKHHEYPQNIFEIGTVFRKFSGTDTGTAEHDSLAVILCSENMDFTRLNQALHYLFRMIDVSYEIQDAENASFIKGRAGKIMAGKKEMGVIGELSPKVISGFGLGYPLAAFEINLDELFNLME